MVDKHEENILQRPKYIVQLKSSQLTLRMYLIFPLHLESPKCRYRIANRHELIAVHRSEISFWRKKAGVFGSKCTTSETLPPQKGRSNKNDNHNVLYDERVSQPMLTHSLVKCSLIVLGNARFWYMNVDMARQLVGMPIPRLVGRVRSCGE